MEAESKCPKCSGEMTEGFILDYGDYNVKQQQIWVEGQPEASFWSGIKTSHKKAFNVQAFRCADCKFLEFYTTDKVDLDGFFN
jgi:predicted nucleic-acid-binding Zn-ribbon protein